METIKPNDFAIRAFAPIIFPVPRNKHRSREGMTMSFATIHYSVVFTVMYVMTGSALIGDTIALVEPAINTVVYDFHE